jgi:hypothetical protein
MVTQFLCPHCREKSNIQIRGQRPHLVSCTTDICQKLLVVTPNTSEKDGTISISLQVLRVEAAPAMLQQQAG